MDGLRGIAIIWVVAFHFAWLSAIQPDVSLFGLTFDFGFLTSTGYLGVELFFFLSGFCIYLPVAQSLRSGTTFSFWQFAARRLLKIVPSYYVSLVLVLALGPLLFFPVRDLVWQIISHVLFVYNFSTSSVAALNGVLWTLAIEVQFYALFPAFCWAFKRSVPVAFAAMSAIAIVYRFWAAAHYDTASFVQFQLPAFLDFFAAGMLGAYLYVNIGSRVTTVSSRLSRNWTLGAVASVAALVVFMRFVVWGWYQRSSQAVDRADVLFYLAIGFLAVTVTGLFAAPAWRRALASRPLVFAATISYNLYLYHLIIGMSLVYRLHFPPALTKIAELDPHWRWPFLLVATLASVIVASAATYLLERPILRWGKSLIARAQMEWSNRSLTPTPPSNIRPTLGLGGTT